MNMKDFISRIDNIIDEKLMDKDQDWHIWATGAAYVLFELQDYLKESDSS